MQRIYEALDKKANRLACDKQVNEEAFIGFKSKDYGETLAKINKFVRWY